MSRVTKNQPKGQKNHKVAVTDGTGGKDKTERDLVTEKEEKDRGNTHD